MAAKYQLITELYRRTGVTIAKSPQAWQSFLSSACHNYKCRFDEQLLIYAQRPDAVAVAQLETWNKQFKRWVNKDSKGIAVFDPKGRRNTLKYYFDISDTHEGYYGSRPVPIWQMRERYEQAVIERLSDRFGDVESTDLASVLMETAKNAVEDNLQDYMPQLKSCTQDSLLEGLDEYNIEVIYRQLAVNSVAYMLMSRLNVHNRLEFTVTTGSASDKFGFSFARGTDSGKYYSLILNPESDETRKLNFEEEGSAGKGYIDGIDSYMFSTPSDNVYHVTVCTDNSVCTVYVNDVLAYTNRIYGTQKNCWSINCYGGDITVGGIGVRYY